MATFQDLAQEPGDDRWRPPKVIVVAPDAFASEWAQRPSEPVEMGLRLVPDQDLQTARAEAAKLAQQMHEDINTQEAVDCFNDALLRWRIARSTCSVDDLRRPWFDFAEDTVRRALTPEGVKAIAFEIEVFEAETSPLYAPADDERIADLQAILEQGAPWAKMSEAEQRGTRRLLAVVLDRFGEAMARDVAS